MDSNVFKVRNEEDEQKNELIEHQGEVVEGDDIKLHSRVPLLGRKIIKTELIC